MRPFEIWQAPFDKTGLSVFSGGYDPAAGYELVWSSTLEEADIVAGFDARSDPLALERIFRRFQRIDAGHMPPKGYKGRSLSSGDLVRLSGRWYWCALEGWEDVTLQGFPSGEKKSWLSRILGVLR